MPKNEDISDTFGCQGTSKSSLGECKTHRSLCWCLGCVPFPMVSKKKWYIDEYGHKTLNCTKIAVFVYQNILTRTPINLS